MATPDQVTQMKMEAMAALTAPGARFELGPVTVAHGPTYNKCMKNAWPSLAAFYEDTFARLPGSDFLVFDDERFTFSQVDAVSAAVAHALENTLGVQAGDRVAIGMRNYPEWCLSYISATRMGAVAVPLNSLWKDAEYAYGLQDSGTKVYICDEDRYRMAKAACDRLGVKVVIARARSLPAGCISFADLASAGAGKKPSRTTVCHDDMATIMYTSGTTGNPKGVVLTHRNICQQMMMSDFSAAMTDMLTQKMGVAGPPQMCCILPIPLFHVTGLVHLLLASPINGRKLVLMPRWDPLRALQLIEREKATVWIGVPTMIQDMMEHPDFDRYDTSSLTAVGSGGGPTPKSQVPKAASKFKSSGRNGISNGYGLTETSGAVCFVMGEMYQQKPTTIGPPCVIAEIQVRNVDSGAVVGPNESGELFIKSPLVMKEYYNKPEKTAEVLDKDGWFASGDIGMLDEDGFAYILDRAKDLIIRGGENISCAEVEAAFIGTGNVMECAAVGIPDDRLGEIVGLMVVRSSAGKDVTAKQLREQVVGNIAGFKIPDEDFIFFSEGKLPRGATEKIQKRDIRDSLVAQLGRARSKL